MLGVVTLANALQKAQDADLDLVEISPNTDPPVCKIINYGKFRYENQKKRHEAKKKQKVVEIKEVKLRPTIDKNDLQIKTRAAIRFLEEGNKVKFTLRFRGREMAHQNIGMDVLLGVKQELEPLSKVEAHPKFEGRQITMLLSPK